MPEPPHSLQMFRRLPCSQMPEPPHSLQYLRSLPCSQRPEPPHSLQYLRSLPCSQMLAPPHSLHWLRRLPCSQIFAPPHSLHVLRTLPCSQMLEPPHSLQLCRTLPCSQIPFPGHSLHKYPRSAFPCGHNGPRGPFASPERDRLPRFASMTVCLARSAVTFVGRSEDLDERSVFSESFGMTNRRDGCCSIFGSSSPACTGNMISAPAPRSSRSLFWFEPMRSVVSGARWPPLPQARPPRPPRAPLALDAPRPRR
jgi:hypothetical protein